MYSFNLFLGFDLHPVQLKKQTFCLEFNILLVNKDAQGMVGKRGGAKAQPG